MSLSNLSETTDKPDNLRHCAKIKALLQLIVIEITILVRI